MYPNIFILMKTLCMTQINYMGLAKGFDYSRITVGKELEAELDHTEKKSVGNIGVSRN